MALIVQGYASPAATSQRVCRISDGQADDQSHHPACWLVDNPFSPRPEAERQLAPATNRRCDGCANIGDLSALPHGQGDDLLTQFLF